MATIEVSEKADWKLFEDMPRAVEQGLGGRWKEKLDGPDQRYWGSVGGRTHAYPAP